MIPINNLGPENASLGDEIGRRLQALLRSGDFILGREVAEFEARFAAFHGARHAVGVGSGTDALALTLRALEVGPGDEVITVPNTFIATVAAVVQCGATPVLVDVGDDENLDPDRIEPALTPRTRAIIPVHLRGRPARMDRIVDIARRHGLAIVEDCAQAHGARYAGRLVGTFGAAGCFSFHPQKILGACGDAGAVITQDGDLAGRLRTLRNHGLLSRDEVARWGQNSRLDTLQAAVLNVKLPYLAGWIERRRALARLYLEALAGLPLRLPHEAEAEFCVYYLFTLETDRRDELLRFLGQNGVDARVHYPEPIQRQPAAVHSGLASDRLPRSLRQSREILSLPLYPSLTDGQAEYVAATIRRFFGA